MRARFPNPPAVAVPLALLLVAGAAQVSMAACDLIPQPARALRGARGNVNRPFAGPGDPVVLRSSEECDQLAGFDALSGPPLVTIVFKPVSGRRNLTVLADDCAEVDTSQCDSFGFDSVECLDASAGHAPPRVEDGALRFDFPDTDAQFGPPDDGRGFTGAAAIAVSIAGDSLPCFLAGEDCSMHPELPACIDALLSTDGPCGQTRHPVFSHFIALPPPNDYRALCVSPPGLPPSPCLGTADEILFTVDGQGNIVLPMNWHGILPDTLFPVGRMLRGTSSIGAFADGGEPISLAGGEFLESYSPTGGRLPPLFEPQRTVGGEFTLFGTADSPTTVLRILARGPTGMACDAGERVDLSCRSAADCPGGACVAAPPRFDFARRLDGGAGPVVIERSGPGVCEDTGEPCTADVECPGSVCVAFRLLAEQSIPLDAVLETERLFVFVVPEGIDGTDLNDDGDTDDEILVLADRQTGILQPIGVDVAMGRAAARLRELPFTFLAFAAEDDVVAFLEPEPFEGRADKNGDRDLLDTILRVFRLGEGADVTGSLEIAADAAPVIGGQAVAVSGGLVFYRQREAAQCRQVVTRVTERVPEGGGEPTPSNGANFAPSVSADGRFVALVSDATNLTEEPIEGRNVLLHDRQQGATVAVARTLNQFSALSPDGGHVAFTGMGGGFFVSDLSAGETVRVDVNNRGEEANFDIVPDPGRIGLSQAGRFVAFASPATNLVDDPFDLPFVDIFLHDRGNGTAFSTIRLSETPQGMGNGINDPLPSISADGSVVAFSSSGDLIAANDLHAGRDAIVYDSRSSASVVSVDSVGRPANGDSFLPSVSGDGRVVTFLSSASNLVAGDTNEAVDVFLHDRRSGQTTRVSLDTLGDELTGNSTGSIPALSFDGRFVVFGRTNVFVHDRVLGFSRKVGIDPDGTFVFDRGTENPTISGSGDVIAFVGRIHDPDAGRIRSDVYVRGCDPADLETDLNGDGDHADTVLRVLDAGDPAPEPQTIGEAGTVEVVGGLAAFLGASPGAGDAPVHLYRDGAVTPLGRNASAIALAADWVAALVAEAEVSDSSVNGDADRDDRIAAIRSTAGSSEWIDVAHAADAVGVRGSLLAFVVPENAEGADLTGDGDRADRVLGLYAAPDGPVRIVTDPLRSGVPVEEFVLGPTFCVDEAEIGAACDSDADCGGAGTCLPALVALRSREGALCAETVDSSNCAAAAAQCDCDLNDDGDCCDDVMRVYDVAGRALVETARAVTPCADETCDPRVPYRVGRDTVTFLIPECGEAGTETTGCPEGGRDLNGDGDASDVILQVFNARAALESPDDGFARTSPLQNGGGVLPPLGSITSGLCSNSGEACSTSGECGGGVCFAPPGRCLQNLGNPCNPAAPVACPGDQACLGEPGATTCRADLGSCTSDADCRAGESCTDADACSCGPSEAAPQIAVLDDVIADEQRTARLIGPLSARGVASAVFPGSGRCVRQLGPCEEARCPAGSVCARADVCEQFQGSCRSAADCPSPEFFCRQVPILAAARDSDGDELPDSFDNCPFDANILQQDSDGDEVGDACDPTGPVATATATPTPTLPPLASPTSTPAPSSTQTPAATPTASATATATLTPTAPVHCPGDCDGSGGIELGELIHGVNIALGRTPLGRCSSFDANGDELITIDELLSGVRAALGDCAA
jgi:Tol biopolymer transport system component